jgi:hypothetical protein
MPGAVKFIGDSPNLGKWHLPNVNGASFENLVAKALHWSLQPASRDLTIKQTRRVHDGGKDVVITSRAPLSLAGFNLQKNEKETFSVYVECKYTAGERLPGDFRQNFSQFGDKFPDYFMLATNSTITPYNHYTASQECARRGCRFLLADKYLLYNFLKSTIVDRSGEWQGEPPNGTDSLVIEYQTDREPVRDNRDVLIYLAIRNYTDRKAPCDLKLITDENWTLAEEASSSEMERRMIFVVEPFEAVTVKLLATKVANIGLQDLRITLNVSEQPKEILVFNRNLGFDFRLPFFGASHRSICQEVTQKISYAIQKGFGRVYVSITGSAGIGKSRIIEELYESYGLNLTPDYVFFGKGSEADTVSRLLRKAGFAAQTDSPHDQLAEFFATFSPDFEHRIFVLEDLHHASKEIIDCIKSHLSQNFTRGVSGTTIFLLTGRNDFTFPNEDYFSLLELLTINDQSDHICTFEVPPLTDDETKSLIRSAIQNIPDFALGKIFDLSENTPFYVVQTIEYLLEIRMARLLNRNTVGIPEIEKFNSKDVLPEKIDEIYEARFEALSFLTQGSIIRDLLLVSSFFGFLVPRDVPETVLDGVDNEKIFAIVLGRRFLEYKDDGQLTFSHENLLHFLRSYARRPENRLAASTAPLRYPNLLALLPQHDQGEVLLLNGRARESRPFFRDIKESISILNNVSSEDLNTNYYKYLDCLFEVELMHGATSSSLKKIVQAHAYMSIHNFPLYKGVEACGEAIENVDKIGLSNKSARALKASLRQLQAHGLLNMGHTQEARQLMLELDLDARLNRDLARQHDMLFDLYDRLHELYKKFNHYHLAENYGRLAQRVARKCRNKKMLACSAITFVGMDLYKSPERAYALAGEAHSLATNYGAYRLGQYTELSLRLIESLLNRDDRNALSSLRAKVRDIAELAARENRPDSLMRSQLLLATLTYYIEPSNRQARDLAKQYAEAGLNASIKFGNGLFVWLFFNLKAVISLVEHQPTDWVLREFRSSIESIQRQSLLFLGSVDVCYPNIFVLSNYLLYLMNELGEKAAYEFLARIESYQSNRQSLMSNYSAILGKLSASRVLFKEKGDYAVFWDPISGYSLPVL